MQNFLKIRAKKNSEIIFKCEISSGLAKETFQRRRGIENKNDIISFNEILTINEFTTLNKPLLRKVKKDIGDENSVKLWNSIQFFVCKSLHLPLKSLFLDENRTLVYLQLKAKTVAQIEKIAKQDRRTFDQMLEVMIEDWIEEKKKK